MISKRSFYNTENDLDWLLSTHLKRVKTRFGWVRSFVLYGNEDCPDRVDLYDVREPEFDEDPAVCVVFP